MAEIKDSDINKLIWPFYDVCLLMKILDFYLKEGMYDKKKLLEQKLKLLANVKMDDALRRTHKEVYGNANFPPFYDEQAANVKTSKASMEETLQDLLETLRSEEGAKMLSGEKTLDINEITKNIDVDEKQLETLFDYAKLLYDSGEYKEATMLLYFFENASNSREDITMALWGELSGYIILNQKEKYCNAFIRLKENIDSLESGGEQARARAWLLHWSLFVFFGDEENASTFYEFALEPGYRYIIETSCTHLLRYVITSLLLAKNRAIMQLVLPILSKKGNIYSDSFTELIEAMGETFSFDRVPEIVRKIRQTCEVDYFLKSYSDRVVGGIRELAVRSYAKVYSVIPVDKLVKISELPLDEAAKVAQSEIREHRTIGTLSADKKTITVALQDTDMNRRIVEKGKELEERTKKLIELFKGK